MLIAQQYTDRNISWFWWSDEWSSRPNFENADKKKVRIWRWYMSDHWSTDASLTVDSQFIVWKGQKGLSGEMYKRCSSDTDTIFRDFVDPFLQGTSLVLQVGGHGSYLKNEKKQSILISTSCNGENILCGNHVLTSARSSRDCLVGMVLSLSIRPIATKTIDMQL